MTSVGGVGAALSSKRFVQSSKEVAAQQPGKNRTRHDAVGILLAHSVLPENM
jgi:hypothetical protein